MQSVVDADRDLSQCPQLEERLQSQDTIGWGDLVAAIRRILA